MGLTQYIWPTLMLLFTVTGGQDLFPDAVIEDNDGLDGLQGFDGATEIPTITTTLTITPSTPTSTALPTPTLTSTSSVVVTAVSTTPTLTITPSVVTDFPTTPASSAITPSTSVIQPTQTVVNCRRLSAPTNGAVEEQCTFVVCTAVYTCDTGFELQGEGSLTCLLGGRLSGAPPLCVQIDCGPLFVEDGTYTGGTLYGDSGTVTCDENFQLSSDSNATVECGENGWSSDPTCEFVECGVPPSPTNGIVTHQCTTVGCLASYDCIEGFAPSPTTTTVECMDILGWTHDVVCVDTTSDASFDATVTLDLDEPVTNTLEDAIHTVIFNHFQDVLGDYLIDAVTYIDPTTGVINFTVIVQNEDTALRRLSVGFSGLSRGSLVDILGQQVLVEGSTVLGNNVFLGATGCDIYENVFKGVCPDGTICVVRDNVTLCDVIQGPIEEDDNLPLLIGLGVGIPLAVLAILAAICCCYWCCCVKPIADDESEDGRPFWHPGWLPRYKYFAVRLDTKRTRMPDYFYTPPYSSRSVSSSRTRTSSRSMSRSRSNHSRTSRSIDSLSPRSLSTGRRRRDQPYSNFSWDNLFHSNFAW